MTTTYRLTYRGTDGYYGPVPFQPITHSHDMAVKQLLGYDQPDLPEYIETLYIEHRECGEPIEYCDCEGVDHDGL